MATNDRIASNQPRAETRNFSEDLARLKVSLSFAITIIDIFRADAPQKRFETLRSQGSFLARLARARNILETDGLANEALEAIENFRSELKLASRKKWRL